MTAANGGQMAVNNAAMAHQHQTAANAAMAAMNYYQNYYSGYYSPAYQQQMQPQMPPHGYPYAYMRPPVGQPMVPIVPQMHNLTPNMAAIVNSTNNLVNNKANNKTGDFKPTTTPAANNSNANNNYNNNHNNVDDSDSDSDPTVAKHGSSTKASNVLPIHCNEKMGLNPLIFQNIQQSPYFKNNLFQLKTYHEVIDEIFYSVQHLEPWEKGSRKVGGQTGMCGSVRGVGAGGIISTPFCILYKLYTLKLTRKQVNGLIRHKDSPYIRALGFMYIRFTQPPPHLFNWFEPFLDDEEEVDPKAGGGQPMTMGQMTRHMLSKLDWFSTLFPRIPVPVQKEIQSKLRQHDEEYEQQLRDERGIEDGEVEDEEEGGGGEDGGDYDRRDRRRRDRKQRSPEQQRERRHSTDRRRSRSRDRDRRSRSRDDKRSSNDNKHRHRRSKSPQSPHSRRHRDDHRSDRSGDHKRKHR
ncbi:pre-mRNA-splicing factor 38B-like isoform X2 [Oppia nitens]|nr:pre-mRNA-splicing factor 38B-like isoform X2 [Oppia nitens]